MVWRPGVLLGFLGVGLRVTEAMGSWQWAVGMRQWAMEQGSWGRGGGGLGGWLLELCARFGRVREGVRDGEEGGEEGG